ncbi:MAG: glycosyltransferase, partial [Lachnospiraceae bacterium]
YRFMNKKWQVKELAKLEYIIDKGNELIYNDQDALNVILKDERRQLPVKYNVTPHHFLKNSDNYPKEMQEEIRDARIDPIIFHYLGKIKPWSLGCYIPGKDLFKKYQKASGWWHCTIQKHVFKRIIYTLFPNIKKKAWENKTYIEGWESFFEKYQVWI